jgi:antitoxin VapB
MSSCYGGLVPLNIKDQDTDRLVRQLAGATGERITTATRQAVDERLARVQAQSAARAEKDVLVELVRRGRARADRDTRTSDEIIGYDERGLPA